jgi:hypothetical protein
LPQFGHRLVLLLLFSLLVARLLLLALQVIDEQAQMISSCLLCRS